MIERSIAQSVFRIAPYPWFPDMDGITMKQEGAAYIFRKDSFGFTIHRKPGFRFQRSAGLIDQFVEGWIRPILPPDALWLRAPHHAQQTMRIGKIVIERADTDR